MLNMLTFTYFNYSFSFFTIFDLRTGGSELSVSRDPLMDPDPHVENH